MTIRKDKSLKLKVGDVCIATDKGTVYWLIVTRRTPHMVLLARLERKVLEYNDKKKEGFEVPLFDSENRPVFSRDNETYRRWVDRHQLTLGKTINFDSKVSDVVWFSRSGGSVKLWDGSSPEKFKAWLQESYRRFDT